ncbi:ASKHA domain-containing protein [Blautia obeum]|nr:ASKHA domain-containing protein [Blautia obeum]
MENFYELHDLTFSIKKETVFKSMNCYEDSPVYEDVVDAYEEIYEDMLALVEPVGIFGFGILPKSVETKKYKAGTPIIYMVTSIGDGIKKCSTKAFQEGDYVKGMLCDAMADDALFSMEDQVVEKLKEICAEHQVGVAARLEAPHDISMESQKEAWEHLELKKRFGIDISTGYMFDPVKTSCQVFILTEDTSTFNAHHDCRKCPNVNCKLRNIPDTEVIVHKGNEVKTILVKGTESLLDALIRENYYVSAVCGGKGRCGKCRIRVLSGETLITDEDKAVFTKEELAAGWRLSCRVYPYEELEISFEQNDESQFEILSSYQGEASGSVGEESAYDIAVDIGTTTIAMELLGGDSKKVIHTVTTINGQRVYGADVISRIKASTDGKKQGLQDSIRRDLQKGISRLVQETGISRDKVKNIVIGGNTTMGHLLMGYDCDTLGVYPFTPVNIDFIEGTDKEIIGEGTGGAKVTLLPGISTYVGGDIVSGLYACGFEKTSDVCLLVDLGTNGEMALGNKDRILVTSTAAGPAFEGGNITWGTGSIPGAICSVKLEGTDVQVKTIRDQAPEGICGTGVVEITAELVREEIVSDSGVLDDEFFERGFPLAKTPDGKEIVFTQKDVREIQLAKAAVRAGVETLLLRYGIEKEDVSRVYLAGGFGYKLDTSKAIAIGMLPEEFKDRIEAVGNSSLAGAVKYLSNPDGDKEIRKLVELSDEIGLSSDKDFNEFYMDAMFFEEE